MSFAPQTNDKILTKSATDKNGVELKIGQIVIIPGVDMAKIVSIEGKRIGLNHKSNTFYFNSRVLEFAEFETIIDTDPPLTYTEAEMEQCFMAGFRQCLYIECDSIGSFVPDFQEFIQSLNTPKP